MKKILITGGAGFIGTNLTKELLKNKNEIFCIDNFYSSSKKNIEQFRNNKRFHFIHHDVIKPIKINKKIDQIYNLACPASPIHYQRDPIYTMKTNVVGAFNICEFAKKNNCSLLQASTSEIYGDPDVHPQKESYNGNVNTLGPRSCYDEGKRSAETIIYDYYKIFKLNIKIARIFNTYGPFMQQNDGRVVSNFIVNALNQKKIIINGQGKQTRSFCYIDDLVTALIKLMNKNSKFNGPFNIGNPEEYNVRQLASIVLKLTKSKSKIHYSKMQLNDPKKRKPDISKFSKNYKWKPKISLDDGLLKTIKYFREIQS
tara:strand:- start:3592 stop:4533 length:942 start_codon:yes stop_codon:yes gene_type:complete